MLQLNCTYFLMFLEKCKEMNSEGWLKTCAQYCIKCTSQYLPYAVNLSINDEVEFSFIKKGLVSDHFLLTLLLLC